MLAEQELAGVAPWFLELSGEKAFPRDGETFAWGDCTLSCSLENWKRCRARSQSGEGVGKPLYERLKEHSLLGLMKGRLRDVIAQADKHKRGRGAS